MVPHQISCSLALQGFSQQHLSDKVDKYLAKHGVKGGVYLMDLNKPETGVKRLKMKSTGAFNVDTFHPHGISVWEDKETGWGCSIF